MKGLGFLNRIVGAVKHAVGIGHAPKAKVRTTPEHQTTPRTKADFAKIFRGRAAVNHASVPRSIRKPGSGFAGAKKRPRARGLVWAGLTTPQELIRRPDVVAARSGLGMWYVRREMRARKQKEMAELRKAGGFTKRQGASELFRMAMARNHAQAQVREDNDAAVGEVMS